MKTLQLKIFSVLVICFLTVACSTKKDAMLNRGFHGMTTKYNILYNGGSAFEQGELNLRENYYDNFWEILPIERMQVEERLIGENEPKDPDFQLAEEKAVKAIQKHSMYIGGREKNTQMDNAYMLLGKSRYYDNRFIPALESFNFILYKSPGSNLIHEAKVWREKTNLRLKYDELAIKNLKELFRDEDLKGQVHADALATLSQAYINLNYLDSARVELKTARNLTSLKEERARYTFILGQLSAKLGDRAEAVAYFDEVIDMNRKSPRQYVIQSYAQKLESQEFDMIDSISFLERYTKLLRDRENRPYLDLIHRQLGVFYLRNGNDLKAVDYFKQSVRESKGDDQLKARNFLDIGEVYFNSAKYEFAGQYYDSAIALLPTRSSEAYRVAKKRESLHDVVLYEKTARDNDSLLRLVALSDADKRTYFQDYVNDLRQADFKKLNAQLAGGGGGQDNFFNMPNFGSAIDAAQQSKGGSGGSGFYFYSQTAVSYGKLEFQKRWGGRSLVDNWKFNKESLGDDVIEGVGGDEETEIASKEAEFEDPRYDIQGYLDQLPTDSIEIMAMKKDRDFAYFQLGAIYSEKFAELALGANKLEALLLFEPEERLVLPTLYKLYRIYSSIDEHKAVRIKSRIVTDYPESRYALLLQNRLGDYEFDITVEELYLDLNRDYVAGDYSTLLDELNKGIEQFEDDDYVSKLELLKANVVGRLEGVGAYKAALNYVGLTYASTQEGKEANRILAEEVPSLEAKKIVDGGVESGHWKIIYPISVEALDGSMMLESKLKLFAMDRQGSDVKFSRDYYNSDLIFFVVHGASSKSNAEAIAAFLKESKNYAIEAKPYFMSSDNYAVVQIKKLWDSFLQKDKE